MGLQTHSPQGPVALPESVNFINSVESFTRFPFTDLLPHARPGSRAAEVRAPSTPPSPRAPELGQH